MHVAEARAAEFHATDGSALIGERHGHAVRRVGIDRAERDVFEIRCRSFEGCCFCLLVRWILVRWFPILCGLRFQVCCNTGIGILICDQLLSHFALFGLFRRLGLGPKRNHQQEAERQK